MLHFKVFPQNTVNSKTNIKPSNSYENYILSGAIFKKIT